VISFTKLAKDTAITIVNYDHNKIIAQEIGHFLKVFSIGKPLFSMQKQASLLLIDCNESGIKCNHRHLSKKDCLMARTASLVCFISTVNGRSKRRRRRRRRSRLGRPALEAGT
jgi:hypothetical protein